MKFNLFENLTGRAQADYNKNFTGIDPEIFEEICKMDPKTLITGDSIAIVGPWAKQLLLPNYLKGETDFILNPQDVRNALEKYIPNIAKYPKPAEFASVADFLQFMENPTATFDNKAKETAKEDPITKLYDQYYSKLPRETFDRLIQLDPQTTDESIGTVAAQLILPKYIAGDNSVDLYAEADVIKVISTFYRDRAQYPNEKQQLSNYESFGNFYTYIDDVPDSAFVVALKNGDWSYNAEDYRNPGREDAKTHHTIDQDIDFIGATSDYNVLSPKSQLANFAISGGYGVPNGMR